MYARPWLLACLCASFLAGCGPKTTPTAVPPQATTTPAAGQSATPQTQPTLRSLDQKALLKLADMQPAVARPEKKPSDIPTDARAAEQLAKGRESFERGEYASALFALERAQGFDPNSPEIRRLLALSHVRLGSLERAGTHLKAVADVAGDDAQVQLMLGQYLSAAGEREGALQALRRALLCSDAAEGSMVVGETLVCLAEELRKQGYLTAALDAYERLGENIDKHGTIYYESRQLRWLIDRPENLARVRGELLLALNRPAEAVDVLDAAYRLNKTDTRSAQLEVQALLLARKFERAEQIALELLGATPARAQVESLATEIFQASDDSAGPVRMYESFRQRYGSPPAAVGLGLSTTALKLGASEVAMKILAAQADLTPGDVGVAAQVAKAQFAAGQAEQAVQRLITLMAQAAQTSEGADTGAATVRELIDELGPKAVDDATVLAIAKAAREDISPEKHLRHYVAGLLARRTGKAHLAAEQLESAIQARKNFGPAYEALAEVYLQQKRFDQVRTLIVRAQKEVGQSVTTLYLQGRAYLENGEFDKAIDELEKAVQAGGGHVASRLLLAKALVRAGRLQEAEETLRQGTKLTTDMAIPEALGDLYLDQARDALHRYAAILASRPRGVDDEVLFGANAGPTQKLALAMGVAQQMLQRDRENPVGLRLMTQTQLLAGRLSAARQGLEQLRQVAPDDLRTRVLAIRLETAGVQSLGYIGRRRFERTLPDVQELLASGAENREALLLLADLFGLRRRHAEQAEVLGRLYAQAPSNETIAQQYLVALQRAEKYDDMAAAAKKMLDAKPDSESLRMWYAHALVKGGKADEAGSLLEGWAAEASADKARQYEVAQAEALAKSGKADQAHALIDRAMTRESEDDARLSLRMAKLGVYAETKDYDSLESYADRWLANTETDSLLMLVFPTRTSCALLLEGKQYGRAVELGKRHLNVLAGRSDETAKLIVTALRGEIVQALIRAKQRELARTVFEEMLAAEGEDFAFLTVGQSVYQESKDYAKIIDLLQRARKAAGEDDSAGLAMVLNNLGYMWANHGENLDEAESLLRKAFEDDPKPNVQDSLAWVLYKKGKFDEALDNLKAALDSPEGEHAVIFDHAGDASWRAGQHEQAVKMWTEALDLAEAAKELTSDTADEDTLGVLERVPRKLQAAQEHKNPPLAPLGQNAPSPE